MSDLIKLELGEVFRRATPKLERDNSNLGPLIS